MSDLTDDDAGDSGDDGEAEALYEFVAGGESCATCKSLDGTVFSAEPARPHASCDCDIVPVRTHDRSDNPCGALGWYIDNAETERYGDLGRYFLVRVNVVVVCANGTNWEQEVEVDFENADEMFHGEDIFAYMDAEIFNETSDVADEIAAINCPPCVDNQFRCV